MDLRKIIIKKRDGYELHPHEIRDWIKGLVEGAFPKYQVSALLMAIPLMGLYELSILGARFFGKKPPKAEQDVDKH